MSQPGYLSASQTQRRWDAPRHGPALGTGNGNYSNGWLVGWWYCWFLMSLSLLFLWLLLLAAQVAIYRTNRGEVRNGILVNMQPASNTGLLFTSCYTGWFAVAADGPTARPVGSSAAAVIISGPARESGSPGLSLPLLCRPEPDGRPRLEAWILSESISYETVLCDASAGCGCRFVLSLCVCVRLTVQMAGPSRLCFCVKSGQVESEIYLLHRLYLLVTYNLESDGRRPRPQVDRADRESPRRVGPGRGP